MGFFRKHRLLLGILSVIFMGLPQAIEAFWSLAERVTGANITMPTISISWFTWFTVPIGLGLLVIIYLQGRQNRGAVSPELKTVKKELDLIISAIAEAKEVTRKGHPVKVYIASDNGLDAVFPEELRDILLKLQDDEGIIKIELFPDWLLPSTPFTIDKHNSTIKAILETSRKQFIVQTLHGFDKWCTDYKAKTKSQIK